MMMTMLKKKRELDFWAGKLSGGQSWTGDPFSFALIIIARPPEKFKWGVL